MKKLKTDNFDHQEFTEISSWKIVDEFFRNHSLTSQQIESFNDFMDNVIPKLLENLDPIEIDDRIKKVRHIYKFEASSFMVTLPSSFEADGTIAKEILPHDARLRNLTYSSNLYVRIRHSTISGRKLERVNSTESKKPRFLGSLPIMVKSKFCRLSTFRTEKDYEWKKENAMDPGGFFIINGKERVVLTQERAADNTVFVFPVFTNSRCKLECEIRSLPEENVGAACAFWVKLFKSSVRSQRKAEGKKIYTSSIVNSSKFVLRAIFPEISAVDGFDVLLLYQAIGFKNQQDVYESVIELNTIQSLDEKTLPQSRSNVTSIFLETLNGWKSRTEQEAKDEIGLLYVPPKLEGDVEDFDPDEVVEYNLEKRRNFVEDLLCSKFLPHLGTTEASFKEKGLFLSFMIWKLLMVHTGDIPVDDRDHIQNKRFKCSGPLLAQIFHRSITLMIQSIRTSLITQLRNKKPLNISEAIPTRFLLNQFIYSLGTGNWANTRHKLSMESRIYSNVTQELNRYTRASHLSSLRRLNSPLDKLQLMTRPRQLHNTYFGVICPFETPEGTPVGLVKNMSLLTQISVSSSVQTIVNFLKEETNIIDLNAALSSKIYRKGLTKVFVEANWIGFTDFPEDLVHKFKEGRQRRKLGIYPSINWIIKEKLVEIRVDAGRLCRPLLVVKDNNLLLTLRHIQLLDERKLNWDTLLEMGIIEIIDVRESESILIAMNLEVLKKNSENSLTKYTHMEIHPSLILGICASTIPFANHTPSPRIVYQAAIAKQAMGLCLSNTRYRMDKSSNYLHYAHRPIVQTNAMKYFEYSQTPAGAVCIVAIMTHTGYNMEDSIIVNRSAIQRGLFRSTMYSTIQDTTLRSIDENNEDQEEIFIYPNQANTKDLRLRTGVKSNPMKMYKNLEADGLPAPGEKLGYKPSYNFKIRKHRHFVQDYEDSDEVAVIGKVKVLSKKELEKETERVSGKDARGLNKVKAQWIYADRSKFLRKPLNSIIDEVMLTNNAAGEKLVKVRTRSELQPQIGDKFSSLHGQKGVIGMDFREEDLPFTKDGIVPDIIMNPHGLPSRMTIGQLYESIYGKVGALTGKIMDGSTFHTRNLDEIEDALEKLGFHRLGMETMYNGATGRKIQTPVFIGPTYYQRLKHLVDDKIHSRSRGNVDTLTRQPVKGFSREGGLRLGEMERDCIISNGSATFLIERLMKSSDGTKYDICMQCGLIASKQVLFANIRGQSMSSNVLPSGKSKKHRKITPVQTIKYSTCTRCTPCDVHASTIVETSFCAVQIPYAAKLLIQELMSMNINVRLIPSASICQRGEPSYTSLSYVPGEGASSVFPLLQVLQAYGHIIPANVVDEEASQRRKCAKAIREFNKRAKTYVRSMFEDEEDEIVLPTWFYD